MQQSVVINLDKEKYEQNKKILVARMNMELDEKIEHTVYRIRDWQNEASGAYISFSGGLGSRVLLDINRKYSFSSEKLPALYVDTGLDHKGVKDIALKYADYVVRSKIQFPNVIKKYGYPVISKSQAMAIKKLTTQNLSLKYRNKLLYGDERGTAGKLSNKWHYLLNAPFKISHECCLVLKERPAIKFEQENECFPVTAEMVEESTNRKIVYLQNGCNMWNLKRPKSTPMAFWTQQDLLKYVVKEKLDIAPEYGEIKQDNYGRYYTTKEQRTGCAFCLFGCHLEKQPNRIQRLYNMDRKRYKYCVGGGEFNKNGLWQPNKEGLGLGYVMDYMGIEYRPTGTIKENKNGQLMIV